VANFVFISEWTDVTGEATVGNSSDGKTAVGQGQRIYSRL